MNSGSDSGLVLLLIVAVAGLVWLAQWFNRKSSVGPSSSHVDERSPIVVKTYKGTPDSSAREFHAHAIEMAKQGYFPVRVGGAPSAERAPSSIGVEKARPRCAETIKAAAVVCRYCGHEFGPQASKDSGQGAQK
jgi:hypothetical protein